VQDLARMALILTPRRRFFAWLDSLPGDLPAPRYEDRKALRALYLVPADEDDPVDLQDLIDDYWEPLFDDALAAWAPTTSWPVNRTAHTFRDWFEVELIPSVVDVAAADVDYEPDYAHCGACGTPVGDDAIVVVVRNDTRERWSLAQMSEWRRAQEEMSDEDLEASSSYGDSMMEVIPCCSDKCAAWFESTVDQAVAQKPKRE
jgi:hypothetical protein